MSATEYWKRSPEAISQEISGETVIMDLGSESYFGLNTTGTRVWDLLDGSQSTDSIVQVIAVEFSVDELSVRNDVEELLEALAAEGLAVRVSTD